MAPESKNAAVTGASKTPYPFLSGNTLPDLQKLMMVAPHMQAAMMKLVIDQQRELFAFLESRCNEDMKLASRIGTAKNISDLYMACLDFCKDAAAQYASEAGKAAEMGSQGTIGVLYDIQQRQDEAMAAVNQPKAA